VDKIKFCHFAPSLEKYFWLHLEKSTLPPRKNLSDVHVNGHPDIPTRHTLVCMLATSTANNSTGVTTKHLLTVRAWTPGQHPTNLGCCMTKRKQPVSPLTNGMSAPTQTRPIASFFQDSRLPDRRVLKKFLRSQHRPFLITPPRLKVPAHRDPVKRWNVGKDDWKRFCLFTGESVERFSPSDTLNIYKAYQDFCKSLLSAAKQCISRGRRKKYVPCWEKECETIYRSFLRARAGTASDRAASSLLSWLEQKKQER